MFVLNSTNAQEFNRAGIITHEMNTPDSREFNGTGDFNRLFHSSKNEFTDKEI